MAEPFYTWRAGRAYAGDTIYFWSPTYITGVPNFVTRLRQDTGEYTVPAELTVIPVTRYIDESFWNGFVVGVKIADDAEPDTYTVEWTDPIPPNDTHSFNIVVVASPSPNPPPSPPTTREEIQDAIDAGYSPIVLLPGDYEIDLELDLSSGTPADVVVIDGKGWASFTRKPMDDPPVHSNRFFEVTRSLTLRGITFRGSKFDDFVLHTEPEDLGNFDINVLDCRFENCVLGEGYTAVNDANEGGTLIDHCEFVRAGTYKIPNGTVVNWTIFREATISSQHAYYNGGDFIAGSDDPPVTAVPNRWLVLNSDWVRTTRGMVMQNGPVANGVAAACRFWEIAQGTGNAGECILFEATTGQTGMANNAFIKCHMYTCSGPGIYLNGGGMNHNLFYDITAHTMTDSIRVNEVAGTIHHNRFAAIEMGANLTVSGSCEDNVFSGIVALCNPLRNGNQYASTVFYNPPQPFVDTSTYAATHQNMYDGIYESWPHGLVKVNFIPSIVVGT